MEISKGYCQCGCGEKTKISPRTFNKRRQYKGKPLRYINGHNPKGFQSGAANGNYRGGISLNRATNRRVVSTGSDTGKYLARVIMEKHLGRTLTSNEAVHHINGNTLDDRLENLQVVSRSDHTKIHRRREREARENEI